MTSSLLIVDDEYGIRHNLKAFFSKQNMRVEAVPTGGEALELCRREHMDLVLLDLKLGDMSGMEVLKQLKLSSPETRVIMITGHGDVETAVEAMKLQADHFAIKPLDLMVLNSIVQKTLSGAQSELQLSYLHEREERAQGSPLFPGEVEHAIRLLARNPFTSVLILGETGTGKGVVARTIHGRSSRGQSQFVDINCAGISDTLFESELFGHEKGAFTDAGSLKRGLMEVANGGTIFFDEISELSMVAQAKLLKVLEDKQFRRVGGTASQAVDVRIMVATNVDLEERVSQGRFREDLFYRLNVMPIEMYPLRERPGDILELAHTFIKEFNQICARSIIGISKDAESSLLTNAWPGNIRELRNVIERAILLCDGDTIRSRHLPRTLLTGRPGGNQDSDDLLNLEELERTHIRKVLDLYNQNRVQTAKALGIHRSTLIKKIQKYELDS